MSASYSLDDYVADLRRITAEAADESEIFDRLGPCAQRLVADKSWLKLEYYETDQVTLSLHTYGMHVNHTERSVYDPATNSAEAFQVNLA